MKNKGFTLIEVVVSIGIFATISTIILSILFISFRTSKKSDSIVILKQNGDAAMNQMVTGIRYAQTLISPVSCVTTPVTQSSISIISSSDGGQTTYTCPAGASTTIASNGASLIDTTVATITGCLFTCSQPNINNPPTITIQYVLTAIDTTATKDSSAGVSFQTSVTMRNYIR